MANTMPPAIQPIFIEPHTSSGAINVKAEDVFMDYEEVHMAPNMLSLAGTGNVNVNRSALKEETSGRGFSLLTFGADSLERSFERPKSVSSPVGVVLSDPSEEFPEYAPPASTDLEAREVNINGVIKKFVFPKSGALDIPAIPTPELPACTEGVAAGAAISDVISTNLTSLAANSGATSTTPATAMTLSSTIASESTINSSSRGKVFMMVKTAQNNGTYFLSVDPSILEKTLSLARQKKLKINLPPKGTGAAPNLTPVTFSTPDESQSSFSSNTNTNSLSNVLDEGGNEESVGPDFPRNKKSKCAKGKCGKKKPRRLQAGSRRSLRLHQAVIHDDKLALVEYLQAERLQVEDEYRVPLKDCYVNLGLKRSASDVELSYKQFCMEEKEGSCLLDPDSRSEPVSFGETHPLVLTGSSLSFLNKKAVCSLTTSGDGECNQPPSKRVKLGYVISKEAFKNVEKSVESVRSKLVLNVKPISRTKTTLPSNAFHKSAFNIAGAIGGGTTTQPVTVRSQKSMLSVEPSRSDDSVQCTSIISQASTNQPHVAKFTTLEPMFNIRKPTADDCTITTGLVDPPLLNTGVSNTSKFPFTSAASGKPSLIAESLRTDKQIHPASAVTIQRWAVPRGSMLTSNMPTAISVSSGKSVQQSPVVPSVCVQSNVVSHANSVQTNLITFSNSGPLPPTPLNHANSAQPRSTFSNNPVLQKYVNSSSSNQQSSIPNSIQPIVIQPSTSPYSESFPSVLKVNGQTVPKGKYMLIETSTGKYLTPIKSSLTTVSSAASAKLVGESGSSSPNATQTSAKISYVPGVQQPIIGRIIKTSSSPHTSISVQQNRLLSNACTTSAPKTNPAGVSTAPTTSSNVRFELKKTSTSTGPKFSLSAINAGPTVRVQDNAATSLSVKPVPVLVVKTPDGGCKKVLLEKVEFDDAVQAFNMAQPRQNQLPIPVAQPSCGQPLHRSALGQQIQLVNPVLTSLSSSSKKNVSVSALKKANILKRPSSVDANLLTEPLHFYTHTIKESDREDAKSSPNISTSGEASVNPIKSELRARKQNLSKAIRMEFVGDSHKNKTSNKAKQAPKSTSPEPFDNPLPEGCTAEERIAHLRAKLKYLQESQKSLGSVSDAVRNSQKLLETWDD